MAGAFFALPAMAQVSRPYIVARSGVPIVIASDFSLNPDCSSLGQTAVNLITAPSAGDVMVGQSRRYPSFGAQNPRSVCNRRKLPATVISYRSNQGFTGPDAFVVEEIFPDGTAFKQRFTVNVR